MDKQVSFLDQLFDQGIVTQPGREALRRAS